MFNISYLIYDYFKYKKKLQINYDNEEKEKEIKLFKKPDGYKNVNSSGIKPVEPPGN